MLSIAWNNPILYDLCRRFHWKLLFIEWTKVKYYINVFMICVYFILMNCNLCILIDLNLSKSKVFTPKGKNARLNKQWLLWNRIKSRFPSDFFSFFFCNTFFLAKAAFEKLLLLFHEYILSAVNIDQFIVSTIIIHNNLNLNINPMSCQLSSNSA